MSGSLHLISIRAIYSMDFETESGGESQQRIKTESSRGKIAANIGSGEDAKNSIVWMTITWSFCIAGALSLLMFVLVVTDRDFKYIDEIKSIWSIFIPIITLALGYAFGKSK